VNREVGEISMSDSGNWSHQPPRTALEAAVLGLWRFVLRIEVGVHDDFLASGGDSLAGMIPTPFL
jgi:hypothetical protein